MLLDLDPKNTKKIECFALAIARVNTQQAHCGILYRDGSDTIWLLHLKWHLRLRQQDISEDLNLNYRFVQVKRHKSILKHLAVICSKVARENSDVPYGFNPDVSIDPDTGIIEIKSSGSGLTCATFILSVLKSQALELLREDEWPYDANQKWQAAIIEMLEDQHVTPNISEEHLRLMKEDVGKVRRFTPQEVVGSSTLPPWPIGFNDAQKIATAIDREM